MAASDENRDDLDRILGKPEPDPKSKEAGEFTRTFFGLRADRGQSSRAGSDAGVNTDSAGTGAGLPPKPAAGQFTRFFGRLNDDAPVEFSEAAGDAIHPAAQNQILPSPLMDLSAPAKQAPIRPAPASSYPFAAEDITDQASHFAYPQTTEASGSGATSPPDPFAPRLPKVNIGNNQLADIMGLHSPMFPAPGPDKPQKATGLVAMPGQPQDQLNLPAGPSDFTRVINASVLRSAQGGADTDSGAANSPVQAPLPDAPVPQAAAVPWPSVPVSAPHLEAPRYVPPQPVAPQLSIPAVLARGPQVPSFQAAPPVQQPQLPLREQTFEEKLVAYWPLIAGSIFLLFLALLVILLFALAR